MNQTDKNILKKVDTQIQTLREVGMPTLKELPFKLKLSIQQNGL